MHIEEIVQAIQADRIRITDHAVEEAEDDRLTLDEILASVFRGEIIEKYPKRKPYPGCLICGQVSNTTHVHSVWQYNRKTGWAVLVTVYRPDPARWINWRKRRL